MGFEIYILNQLCDPPEKQEVVANYATNILGELKTRNGIYSNTITLPDTNKNRLIFQNAQLILSATQIPYDKLDCYIRVDGMTLVVGFANLVSTKRGFTLFVIGGNGEWFDKIGSTKLTDLDLVLINHKWEDSQVYGRRSNTWTLGGLYPNADYGEFISQVSTTVQFTGLYYSIYCKYLMQEIFRLKGGFNITGNWWDNNTTFAKSNIPFCGSWKRDRNYQHRDRFSAEYTADQFAATLTGEYNLHTGSVTTTPADDYDFIPSKTFTFSGLFTVTANRHWLVLDSGTLTIDYDLTFDNGGTPTPLGSLGQLVYTDANGDIASVNICDMSTLPANTISNFTGTITQDISRGPIYIRSQGLKIKAGSTINVTITPSEEFEEDLLIDDTFSYITVGSTLPEITCMDFLRTQWNQYGIIFTTDPLTGYINTFSLADVAANLLNVDDWSSRLDLSEDPEIRYRLEGYAQTNILKYATDENDEYLLALPEYGQGIITVDDQNLEIEATLFESVFAPTLRVESFNGAKTMAYIPKFIAGDEVDCTPRITYVEFDGDNNITIGTNTLEATQPNLYFVDLEFQNLINLYYTTLSSVLTEAKVVNCLLRLSRADIANLDFSKPKYISYFGAFFWLNEIKQYKFTSYESVMVELVRI